MDGKVVGRMVEGWWEDGGRVVEDGLRIVGR